MTQSAFSNKRSPHLRFYSWIMAMDLTNIEAKDNHEKNILIIDDDKQIRNLLYKILKSAGYEVFAASDN